MWNCKTPGTELEMLRQRRTEYERKRADQAKEKVKQINGLSNSGSIV
jgi:hypothetical protein